MKWYYKTVGIHIHVRVYAAAGALNGTLIFTPVEWTNVWGRMKMLQLDRLPLVEFFDENPALPVENS